MSCFQTGVKVGGVETQVCMLVPGNEDLAERVRKAEKEQGEKPTASGAEIARALKFYQRFHRPTHHPSAPGNLVDEIRELQKDPELERDYDVPVGGDAPTEYTPEREADIFSAARRRQGPARA